MDRRKMILSGSAVLAAAVLQPLDAFGRSRRLRRRQRRAASSARVSGGVIFNTDFELPEADWIVDVPGGSVFTRVDTSDLDDPATGWTRRVVAQLAQLGQATAPGITYLSPPYFPLMKVGSTKKYEGDVGAYMGLPGGKKKADLERLYVYVFVQDIMGATVMDADSVSQPVWGHATMP